MRINVVLTLLKKEFLNIIRDKKSFIFMILLPLLAFPLMVGLCTLIFTSMTEVSDNTVKFGINYEMDDSFKTFMDEYSDTYTFEIVNDTEDNLKKQFDDGDLGIYILKDGNTYNIHYDENSTSTLAVASVIENLYYDYQEEYVTNRLKEQSIDYEVLKDEFKIEVVQDSITSMGTLVPAMLSMVLTLLISSTAFNVAIEITTSEKEKGTLETILSLPVKKSELIASKYLTTILMSVMSGILTYISLFTSLYFGKKTLAYLGFTGLQISPKILIIYFVAIVLFAIFLSGLILSLSIFSKSLKEAQNTLAPMEAMLAIVSYLPMLGFKASNINAIIPVVNISLLFNNALSSNIEPIFIILTFLSTIVYSMLLIIIVSKLYNEEDILFNSSNLKYMSFTKGKGKRVGFTIFTSILLLVLIYLLALYLSLIFISASTYLLIAIMPLTIIFVLLIASLIVKLDLKKAYGIRKFKFKNFIYLLLLFIGFRIISTYIVELVAYLFPSTIDQISVINNMLSLDNIWLSILLIAVAPAIAEELLFRGVVFNSFSKKYKPWIAIIASALLFGIYHMNWLQGINAFIIGIALGYAFYKTGSIWVPMIFHFLNNLVSVLLDYLPELTFDIPMFINIMLILLACIIIISTFYINERELK